MFKSGALNSEVFAGSKVSLESLIAQNGYALLLGSTQINTGSSNYLAAIEDWTAENSRVTKPAVHKA